eukprot:69612-Prymnesium_polylepis.1
MRVNTTVSSSSSSFSRLLERRSQRSASSRGVSPCALRRVGSALASNRNLHSSMSQWRAAECNAVEPVVAATHAVSLFLEPNLTAMRAENAIQRYANHARGVLSLTPGLPGAFSRARTTSMSMS